MTSDKVIDQTVDHNKEIKEAAAILRRGGLVAFPTETVYGLGADASNEKAVARIFAAKNRPADHPVIVHLARTEEIKHWAREIPAITWRIAERFWPGPLTLIFKRAPTVLDAVTGGQDTIGLRVPGHPVALALLAEFGGGLAAPSANRYGRISPTTATHVKEELGNTVDVVIDGGACKVGLESTILDLSSEHPRILRPGSVSAEALAEVLGEMPMLGAGDSDSAPRVSGALPSHYAPTTPLQLVHAVDLDSSVQACLSKKQSVIVLSVHQPVVNVKWLAMPSDVIAYGQCLYARLREADKSDVDLIILERPPEGKEWMAIHDRLKRASFKTPQDG